MFIVLNVCTVYVYVCLYNRLLCAICSSIRSSTHTKCSSPWFQSGFGEKFVFFWFFVKISQMENLQHFNQLNKPKISNQLIQNAKPFSTSPANCLSFANFLIPTTNTTKNWRNMCCFSSSHTMLCLYSFTWINVRAIHHHHRIATHPKNNLNSKQKQSSCSMHTTQY